MNKNLIFLLKVLPLYHYLYFNRILEIFFGTLFSWKLIEHSCQSLEDEDDILEDDFETEDDEDEDDENNDKDTELGVDIVEQVNGGCTNKPRFGHILVLSVQVWL